MADTDIHGMLVRIEATTAQLRSEMARADSSVAQASGKIDKSLAEIDKAFDRTGSCAMSAGFTIKTALAAAISAASIGKIIETADGYSQMADRLGMATRSAVEYDTVQARLLETAKRTYRPLNEAQELYIRTADSLKSMGYQTGQALDVMDSFSFLLVTNSASADKAGSAINAYSKALQTGKVDADAWQAILAAMPTVVDTVARSTGKTTEEIRSLGAQGKLSLQLLTEGLQKSAEANGLLADSMGVSVRDALQNLQNAFTVYIGRLNETSDGTGLLAEGIGVLSDNFDTLANVAVVAAIGALAGYGRSAVGAGALAVRSALQDAAARKAQTASVLLAAQAEQQKARTTVYLAEKEALAARGTAVQTQMSLQLAEARMAEARATAAVGAAQTALARASLSLTGLLGGPAGIALLAVGAATAFLTLRDNTSVLERKLGDLNDPLDQLIGRFNKLNRATQAVTLRELRASIKDTEQDLANASRSIAFELQASLAQAGLAGANGFMGGIAPLPTEFQAAMDVVNAAVARAAEGQAVDWKQVADQIRQIPGITEAMAQAIETGQVEVSALSSVLDKQRQTLAELTGETDANTQATRENAAAKEAAAKVGQQYLEQLQRQLNAAQDKTALEAANRFIAEHTDLTEGMIVAIRSAAAAKDAQKAADDAATTARRKNSQETQSAAQKQLKDFASAEEAYRRQIELINTTGDRQRDATEVAKLSFEIQSGKLTGLNSLQQQRLKGLAAELDKLNALQKASEDAVKLSAFRAAQDKANQSMQAGFDQDLAGMGRGDQLRERLRANLALRQQYAQDVANLNEQFNTNQISKSLYEQETQLLGQNLAQRLAMQQAYFDQVDQYQADWTNGATSAWENYRDSAADVAGQTQSMFAKAFTGAEDALTQFVRTGKLSFKSLTNSIIEDLIRIQMRKALAGVVSAAAGGGFMSGMASLFQADGGAWNNGVQMFAKGGAFTNSIVDRPTLFPFAKGTGLMGEAGPEAIMPLTRGPDGALGVRAHGGGDTSAASAPSPVPSIYQTFHVNGDVSQDTLSRMQAMVQQGTREALNAVARDAKMNGPIVQSIRRSVR